MNSKASVYCLVHGAWLGKFCWDEVVRRLEEQGKKAITLDLPAHGDDQTSIEDVSLEHYRDAVIEAIEGLQNVILVGHSMAGMVISAVAEAIPNQISALVYLAAYLPRSGESLYQLSQEDKGSKVGRYWRQDNPENYSPVWIAAEGIVEVFGADCSPFYQKLLIERHRAESVPPLATPVQLTDERYGSVPRYYIETLYDNAVSHQLQTLMTSRVDVQKSFQLSSSHVPFFSMPGQLVSCLNQINEA
jgi:pimeloyl-ACP methyl ester carboxylesterase